MENLVDILIFQAEKDSDRRILTFLTDGEQQEDVLNLGQLQSRAMAVAAELQTRYEPNQRILLLFEPGLDFIVAFWGCLLAGQIAIPLYPPTDPRSHERFLAIAQDSQAVATLTNARILALYRPIRWFKRVLRAMRWIAIDKLSTELGKQWTQPAIDSQKLAMIQYTSGTTGGAKGAMISHGNLIHNMKMLYTAATTLGVHLEPEGHRVVSWLPLYHDMGLVTGTIFPVLQGIDTILMSPLIFIQQPLRWLQAMTRYQAAFSISPNFGYELCIGKIEPEQKKNLDLSHWTAALNGAEVVRYDTIGRFSDAFASCGFKKEAFYPCYGLAESTVFVTAGGATVYLSVDKEALQKNRIVETDDSHALTLVSLGQTWLDQRVVIVNPDTCTPINDEVGEIWISGASVAQGYWNQSELTRNIFGAHLSTGEGPFLRSGDLGFVKNGQLFITGRMKDLIIIRGQNHFPEYIEQTVEKAHPDFRKGRCAAFSMDIDGEEQLVVVQEIKRNLKKPDIHALQQAIKRAVSEKHGLGVYDIRIVLPRVLPKTSSGKVQRVRCKELYLLNKLKHCKPYKN